MNLSKLQLVLNKPSYLFKFLELRKLRKSKRHSNQFTKLLDHKIRIIDGNSFSFLYNEIYIQEIYKFRSNNTVPYIIDCGANIGVSILYFKKIFPLSEIVAFEADESIFNILSSNVHDNKIENVTLIKKAVWNEETELSFYSEGGDAGRVAIDSDTKNIVKVGTVRLRDYINREVDLLKMDIEGAELPVLEDVEDLLFHVNNIFVEFHSFVGKPQNLSKLIKILETAQFRLYVTSPGFSSMHPFVERQQFYNMDMQLNIYGYRQPATNIQ